MSHLGFADSKALNIPSTRDSLELASLADESDLVSESDDASLSSRRLSDDDPLATDSHRPTLTTGHGRSYSVSSAFDFTPALFPLSQTGYAPLAPQTVPLEKNKTLTYLNGLSLVVGLIIGSGIFSSPSQVNVHVGSPGASLIVWAIAGLLAWTGASSYAELGGAIPLNGGAQVYLAKIFGELTGFLFTWTAILVLKPGSAAIIAIILGEYVVRAIIGAEVEVINPWINKAPAFVALALVTFFNVLSTRLAARIGDGFMIFKFIALASITIIGIISAVTGLHYAPRGPANTTWKTQGWFEGTSTSVSDWAVALYAGLWAFDGWDNTNYVTGEFKNAARDLPRVLHTAMPVVIVCYLLANVSYIFVLPFDALNDSNAVAVSFGSKVFGPVGALLLALVVSVSAFGALNATTFTSGRLVYAAGREGYLPELFGRIGFVEKEYTKVQTRSVAVKSLGRVFGDADGTVFATPIMAIVLNAALTAIYILIGEFRTLITFYGCAGYSFYFLTVLGLIVLRIREPNLERPYRTWLATPVVFCCVSLFLVSRAVVNEPLQAAIVVAFVVAGIPVYFWRVAGRNEQHGQWQFWKRWGRS